MYFLDCYEEKIEKPGLQGTMNKIRELVYSFAYVTYMTQSQFNCFCFWFLLHHFFKHSLRQMNAFFEAIIEVVRFFWLLIESIVTIVLDWTLPLAKKDVSNDIVLITGAAGGLGKELALQFYRQNATVILVDLDREGCQRTKEFVLTKGNVNKTDNDSKINVRSNSLRNTVGDHNAVTNDIFVFQCDVSDYENVKELVDEIRQTVGTVSILINNAGIVNGKGLMDISPADYAKTISVNLLAHAWTVKCCLPAMIENGRGIKSS